MKPFKKLPFEFRITIIYIVLGALWIVFPDKVVERIFIDPHQISYVQTYKGWFYVFVTGLLLFLWIRNEIKKRNTLYNQLLESNKKALESDRLKTAFLSNISHYIRTPMNSILGFTELIQNPDIEPEKRERFNELINDQSRHLLQLLNNIIDISKIQTDQVTINYEHFQLNTIIRKIYNSCLLNMMQMNPSVKLSYTTGMPDGQDEINSDIEKIQHIFIQLINNSIKFTHKGEIEFGYNLNDNIYNCYVRDTGCGIPQEKEKHLISGFMFSSPFEWDPSEGIGLGLYLSAGLVKFLGGKLWLEYTSTDGSKFCFTIPKEPKINRS